MPSIGIALGVLGSASSRAATDGAALENSSSTSLRKADYLGAELALNGRSFPLFRQAFVATDANVEFNEVVEIGSVDVWIEPWLTVLRIIEGSWIGEVDGIPVDRGREPPGIDAAVGKVNASLLSDCSDGRG
jgi:hypothetical protein